MDKLVSNKIRNCIVTIVFMYTEMRFCIKIIEDSVINDVCTAFKYALKDFVLARGANKNYSVSFI